MSQMPMSDLDRIVRDLDTARNALQHGFGFDPTGVRALSPAEIVRAAEPLVGHCDGLIVEVAKLRLVAEAARQWIVQMRLALAEGIPREVLIAAIDAASAPGPDDR
ncbi:MAG TPA: hypothetical protein VF180_13345 [Acidimicrobiia bacterium]